jgi:hypothetical protein
MQFLDPMLKYKVLKLEKQGGSYFFSETLGGSYCSAERRTAFLKACAMDSSRPML